MFDTAVIPSGVRPALDWRSVVTAMLAQLDRPALLVDRHGVVRAANEAFSVLSGCPVEEVESSEFRSLFRTAMTVVEEAAARRGREDLISGERFTSPLRLHTRVTEVGSGPLGAYVIEVEGTARLDEHPSRSVSHRRYTVSAAHHALGTLLAVEDATGEMPPMVGGTCFRIVGNRESPCPGCPVFADLSQLPARVVVIPEESSPSTEYQVVDVERQGNDILEVRSVVVREEILGDLVEAKIRWIAREGNLTPREHEILNLLYLGRSTKDIAMLLEISERTAKYHQANVLRKVGADSRVDLVRLLL